eukprot:TRINITY_DN6034_c0_g1_i1.p1 TRINITY_DN6034_c0_g1~~TRINITY_DN6034_c0_g1_i1.p1  ORF type:complete len:180 (+),score=33.11 TRINITY_DN6034_c0_g1_i1:62-601(+)
MSRLVHVRDDGTEGVSLMLEGKKCITFGNDRDNHIVLKGDYYEREAEINDDCVLNVGKDHHVFVNNNVVRKKKFVLTNEDVIEFRTKRGRTKLRRIKFRFYFSKGKLKVSTPRKHNQNTLSTTAAPQVGPKRNQKLKVISSTNPPTLKTISLAPTYNFSYFEFSALKDDGNFESTVHPL